MLGKPHVQTGAVGAPVDEKRHVLVAASVLSPAEIAKQFERHWGVNAERCYFWKLGQNDTYVAEGEGSRWIGRLYRHGVYDDAAVHYELDLIDHLAARGVPAVASIPTSSGERWTELAVAEGSRRLVLFPFAEGSVPAYDDAFPAVAYGRLMGALHREADPFASDHLRPPTDLESLVALPARAAAAWLTEAEASIVARAASSVMSSLSPETTAGLDWGPCHNDVIGNVVHDKNGGLHLFDFASCGPGWRSLELATVLLQFEAWADAPDALWGDFVRGYRQERTLSDDDLAATPLFVAARYLWLLGLHVAMGDLEGHTRDAGYLPRLVRALARWVPPRGRG